MNRPWMPLYVADYLADTMHLNAAQSGAYLHLIMHYWQHGGLPQDDDKLARIARMRIEDWRRHRGTVGAFFQHGWRHARIDRELSRSEEISNKRKHAAKQMHSKCTANAGANAEQLHTQSQSQKKTTSSSLQTRRKPKVALPTDFRLSEQDIDFALSKGWTHAYLQSEFSRFCDHATASARQQADWHAAWRNWVTSPYQKPNGGTNVSTRRHSSEIAMELADKLRAREREEGISEQSDWLGCSGAGGENVIRLAERY